MARFDVAAITLAETRELRQRVLRPHQTLEEVAADEPEGARVMGAFSEGRLVAIGMIARGEDPRVWQLRSMAADSAVRGQGAGSAVLSALLAHARERGAVRVWCNARTPARSLYERAGFRATSEEFEVPQIGPHFRMELLIRSELGEDAREAPQR